PAALAAKPAGTREFTFRAVIAGMLVAAVMGASYPYIVLKLGFGPNVSVVAAFFGYLSLGILFRNFNRWENNIVQTAGTSAAQTIIVLDSRGKEAQNPALALAIGTILSGLLIFFQLPWGGSVIPDTILATLGGLTAATAGAGFSVSLLSIGSGMIVGNRINV